MYKRKLFGIFIFAILFAFLVDFSPTEAASIKLNKTKATVRKEKTVTLKVLNYKKPDKVKWKSSNKKIATVSKGKVTGVKAGNATITAIVGSKKLTCKVTVKNKPSLSKKSVTIRKGSTATIEVKNPGKTITWKSEDNKIATVKDGVITGVSAGETIINITTASYKLKCKVTVIPKPKITGKSHKMEIGDTDDLTVSYWDKDVIWASDDPAVATVNGVGHVKAIAPGTTKIRAAAGKYNLSYEIKIGKPSISKTSVTIEKYKDKTVTVKNYSKTKWSTSNAKVCTVKDGVITGVQKGTATVTAKAASYTFKVKVTVTYLTPNARNFILTQQVYHKGFKKYGEFFFYSFPRSETTWAKALAQVEKAKKTGTTCVVPCRWGIRDLGLSASGFYVKHGKFNKYKMNDKYWGLIKSKGPIGMTIKQAVNAGQLKAGDIIGFKNRTHTVVYSGDGYYVYEGGSLPKRLGYTKVGIKVNYSKYTYKDKKISQVIRWKN